MNLTGKLFTPTPPTSYIGRFSVSPEQLPSTSEHATFLFAELDAHNSRGDIPASEEPQPGWVANLMAALRDVISRLPGPSVRVDEDPALYDSAGPIKFLSDDEGMPATAKTEDYVIAPQARGVRAAAGSGEVVFEEAAEFRFAFRRSILPTWVQPDSLLCIRAKGDSMKPTLNDGDLILLDYSRTNPLDGQIFVLRTNDGLVVKRLRGGGLHWELASDNPAHQPQHVDQNDRVIGRVAWSGTLIDRPSA